MKKLLPFIFVLFTFIVQAQNTPTVRTCHTPTLDLQFENWINSIASSNINSNSKYGSSSIQSVFNIPVIVHIVHNGEAVNSISATNGNNINAAQVIDQINILNDDFNGLNADTTLIPNVFKPLLGKFQINFCLAVVNPTGGILAEPGIDRINRNSKGWTGPPYTTNYFTATIKPNSIWNPNKYLNIWVAPMSSGILGYATFPSPGTSGLSGLTGNFGTATTDGVVILNSAFGSIGTAQFGQYDRGRTATHEIGHWLGLRHVWGDGNCATDFVNDTPPSQTANYGCANFPYKLGVCSGNTTGEMTMNYMDYADDACMYMFTNDQKIRAQLILVHSPIRAALITSTVCNLPTVGNDVGITFVARPTYSQNVNCVDFIDPILNVTNYGSTVLSNFLITYNVDGINTQTLNWVGSANPNTSFTVAIPTISGLSAGPHTFSANLSLPNSGSDNNLSNNNSVQQFVTANVLTITINSATTCPGTAATLSVSGGFGYNWIGLGSGATVTVSPMQTTVYSVNVIGNSCSVLKTTTVSVLPSPTISVNNATVCAGTSTTLNASGATTYTWSTGSSNNSITVSPFSPITYTVFGSNSNGCVASKVASVSILATPTVVVNSHTICSGGTATLIAAGANTYSWDNGASTASILASPASNTVYMVTGTTGSCVNTASVSVTIGTAISIYVNPTSPKVCFGSSVSLSAIGANTYTWSTNSNSNIITVSPLSNTSYTVFGLSGTCPGTTVVTVTVNPLPLTSLSATNVTCFGGSNGQLAASSTGSGPFTYSFNAGSSGLFAGTYTTITTDALGCKTQNTISISQPSPIVTQVITGDTECATSCDGSAVISFTGGTAPFTSTIYPIGSIQQTLSTLCPGTYAYILTDSKGCVGSGNFVINPGNASVIVTSSVTNVSCSSCADATVTATPINGLAPYTYTWIPGNISGAILENVAAGCYTVFVKDAKGCLGETQNCVSFDVGIGALTADALDVSVLPNPSTGIFSLHTNTETLKTIEVFDASGKVLFNQEAKSEIVLVDLSAFENGFYYARIIFNHKLHVVKLLKE